MTVIVKPPELALAVFTSLSLKANESQTRPLSHHQYLVILVTRVVPKGITLFLIISAEVLTTQKGRATVVIGVKDSQN